MEYKFGKSYFERARVGLFTHYTYATYAEGKSTDYGGTWYSRSDSRGAASPEEAAAMFDGEKYARTAHDMGAEYVVFTLAHTGFNLLFPSETMKSVGCYGKCTERSDIISKLISGLDRYGIPLVFYLPPNDAHDIKDDELRKMGWVSDEARMSFLKKLIREIYSKYGRGIKGFWFDQGGPSADVCGFVRECDPDAVIFINTGVTANTVKNPLSDFIVSEYYGSIEGCDSDTLPTHYSQVNRQIGGWWASGRKAPTNARNLYRYTVRTIATEGQFNAGIAWSCGPYIDQTWEDGVRELLGQDPDRLVVVDEAYVDFGAESAAPLLGEYDNLLVVRTFSKSRQLAGARLAFALGREELISDIKTMKFSFNPYSGNRLALIAGEQAMRDTEYFEKCRAEIIENREYTTAALRKLGFAVPESRANFVLAGNRTLGGKRYYEALRDRGILVRYFDKERIRDCVRITIGTRKQMEALVRATEEILTGGKEK